MNDSCVRLSLERQDRQWATWEPAMASLPTDMTALPGLVCLPSCLSHPPLLLSITDTRRLAICSAFISIPQVQRVGRAKPPGSLQVRTKGPNGRKLTPRRGSENKGNKGKISLEMQPPSFGHCADPWRWVFTHFLNLALCAPLSLRSFFSPTPSPHPPMSYR
ncbi:hypothetical protein BO83DRAFT_60427 [Aspergillus eucalypticola CBS 122712]|uniref:Uncharacterized protein n=1 Tax=Aspergillus eucalypticola (strain CBS 122712 / IBT 29274) TaxID=1448314 RepID=A0A317V711_ASPEC|nr:uncharacterized protein BO83DRAFT_60427 [Aspergillus eucalypticola CBS 122712]PWY69886.1 hypothetical protein BO83DRAFT_60427 [Aspergillus eucalypticola CBS 122712]